MIPRLDRVLVGRAAERRLVDELVAGARLGRSGVLLLLGEAGIGKTALLRYARQVADDVRLLEAAGSESERDVPFGGLAQLLRPTDADLDGIPGPQAHALAVALALREGRGGDRLSVGAAVLSLLTRYSEEGPLGLLVDDAHLLDRPSAEALVFALRRLLADPVFAVAAARPDEPSPLTSAELPHRHLDGLDQEATAELLRTHGGPAAGRPDLVHRATGGNPLAVLAMGHDLTRSPWPWPQSPSAVPAALAEWYGRRLDALDPRTRTLLLLVAVGGGEAPEIARAAPMLGVTMTDLPDAERAGLVTVRTDRVDFTHPLVRATVYARAFPDERRAAHAAVAAVQPADRVDRRAWHRAEAALGPDEDTAADLVAAGRRAADRGAHAVSASAHERAARLTTDDEDRAERFVGAAEAAWLAGDAEWATSLLAAAGEAVRDRGTRARTLGLRGHIEATRGSPAVAHELFLAAADEAGDADPSLALGLLAEAVSAAFFQADAAAAVAAGDKADHLLVRHPDDASAALAMLASGMARVLAGLPGSDRIRSAMAQLDAATTGAEDPGSVPPAWLMAGPLWLRESGTGRAMVRRVLDGARTRAAVGTLPLLLFMIARDAATTDHWVSAEAHYGEAIALARELGHTTELAVSLAGLAWLEARLGRTDDCRSHADETLDLCASRQVTLARIWAGLALGESALAQGDVAAAVGSLGELADVLDRIGLHDPDLSPAPDLAEALARSGREDEARTVAAEFRRTATAKGLPWGVARAERLRGLLCAGDDVDDAFGAALALHARTPDVFETARTQLLYGSRLRRARRRSDARAPLRSALETFARLGARPWADAAAAELAATGETVARRDPTDLDRLTPRELQIALLLAEGRTIRETAAALFLSPKTVEYHLRHVYARLGVTSRPQLVARMDAAAG